MSPVLAHCGWCQDCDHIPFAVTGFDPTRACGTALQRIAKAAPHVLKNRRLLWFRALDRRRAFRQRYDSRLSICPRWPRKNGLSNNERGLACDYRASCGVKSVRRPRLWHSRTPSSWRSSSSSLPSTPSPSRCRNMMINYSLADQKSDQASSDLLCRPCQGLR